MAVQPGPVPRGPTGHILKHLLAVSQEGELGLQVVDVGFLGYRLAGVSRHSCAGLSLAPRYWHGGVMLPRAEFWL